MKNFSALFKRLQVVLSIALLALFSGLGAMAANNPSPDGAKANNYIHRGAGNPYLPLWEHLPDGEPRL